MLFKDNEVLYFTYYIDITADGQKEVFVASYDDITARIEEGTVNRWRQKERQINTRELERATKRETDRQTE